MLPDSIWNPSPEGEGGCQWVNVREQDKKKALRPSGRGCKPFPPALDRVTRDAKLTGEVNLSDVAFLHFR